MGEWNKVSSKVLLRTPRFIIRKDEVIRPSGKQAEMYVVQRKAAIFVAALNEKNEIYLIKLYRYMPQKDSWEVVAGGVDENEDLLTAAKRELIEEAGLKAKKWIDLGEMQIAGGMTDGICHIFVAEDLTQTEAIGQLEEGIEEIRPVSFAEAIKMIKSGDITSSQTIAVLMRIGLYLNLVKV